MQCRPLRQTFILPPLNFGRSFDVAAKPREPLCAAARTQGSAPAALKLRNVQEARLLLAAPGYAPAWLVPKPLAAHEDAEGRLQTIARAGCALQHPYVRLF